MLSLSEDRTGESVKYFGKGKIILTYIGTLIKGTREPDQLLRIISSMIRKRPELREKLELHFFGDISMCKENFSRYDEIKDVFISHGMVARSTMHQILADSDFLVNIGNDTSYQLPSKIVEYIFTGKPIINICSTTNDTSSDVLSDHPMALNVFCSESNIEEKVTECLIFIDGNYGKSLNSVDRDRLGKGYTAEVISERYLSLVQ